VHVIIIGGRREALETELGYASLNQGSELQVVGHVKAVVELGTDELEVTAAIDHARLGNGGVLVKQGALQGHAIVQRPVVYGEAFIAHFFHRGAGVRGAAYRHQTAIHRRSDPVRGGGAIEQTGIENSLRALQSQLHILGVAQAPAVGALADALTGTLVGFEVEVLVFTIAAQTEAFAYAVISLVVDHEQELEAAVVREGVLVGAADLPVVNVLVGELTLEGRQADTGSGDLPVQVHGVGIVLVQSVELDAIALEFISQIGAELVSLLVASAFLGHDLVEAQVGRVAVFGAVGVVVLGISQDAEQVAQVAGLTAIGQGGPRVIFAVVVSIRADFHGDAGAAAGILQHDIHHLGGASHVQRAGASADQFDALHLVGGDAGQLGAGGVVLAGQALAIDQQVAARAEPPATTAAAQAHARNTGDHVIGRYRTVLGEEGSRVHYGRFVRGSLSVDDVDAGYSESYRERKCREAEAFADGLPPMLPGCHVSSGSEIIKTHDFLTKFPFNA